ncbi:MAG: hypothetical protein JO033_11735 [Acidobacteriaceae bacterium]|nr:hypothetical protein [Acidobacteriaceae bacterium]MBV9499201.1 hypothetical protein [Acidobacteriaceae bacterium]
MPWTHRSFWLGPLLIAAILLLLALIVSKTRLREIYLRQLGESRRERLFLSSVGFFTAVLVVRAITIAIHNDIGPFHNVSMHGRHIHHLVWGILGLLLVGYMWLLQIGTGQGPSRRWAGAFTSLLFGVAAALTLDEFALWLNLSDVYWERQGRESYEAMALFGGLLGMGVFGAPFLRGIAREFGRSSRSPITKS